MLKVLLYAFLLCSFSANVLAARLEKPYVVDVPVASQSVDERTRASAQGLRQLLLKLTGKSVVDNTVVEQKLGAGVDKYLLQFSYEKGPVSGGYLPASPFLLRLSFSQTAVLQLLHDAELSIWPLDRPRLLMVIRDAQGNWMPLAGQEMLFDQLRQIGSQYGVPIVAPIQDTQDRIDITEQAVQSADAAALQSSIIRYQADALLTGAISGDDTSGWRGRGTLQFHGTSAVIEKTAADLPQLLNALLSEVTVQLSGQYRESASHDTGASTIRLEVEGVNSYGAYTQLRDYLQKLDAVKRLNVAQIAGSVVRLDVDVTGEESFRSLLDLSRQLVKQEAVDSVVDASASVPPVAVSAASVPATPTTAAPDASANATEAAVSGAVAVWRYRWQP